MKINEILTEGQLEELNWRKGLATAALGAAALGGMGGAQARVTPDDDPNINRFTGKPVATQQASASTADKVERTESGAIISHGGKEYNAKFVPAGSPTPRGAKVIKVDQAQLGERGIGSYTTYLLPNGNAYIYR